MSRPPPATRLDTATEHHRRGDLGEARRLYAEVLRAEPAHDLALFRFGLLELQEGRHEAAATLIRAASTAAAWACTSALAAWMPRRTRPNRSTS